MHAVALRCDNGHGVNPVTFVIWRSTSRTAAVRHALNQHDWAISAWRCLRGGCLSERVAAAFWRSNWLSRKSLPSGRTGILDRAVWA
jgi:hypothetical protein